MSQRSSSSHGLLIRPKMRRNVGDEIGAVVTRETGCGSSLIYVNRRNKLHRWHLRWPREDCWKGTVWADSSPASILVRQPERVALQLNLRPTSRGTHHGTLFAGRTERTDHRPT